MASIIQPVTHFDPWEIPTEPVRRFTVAEYRRLTDLGFFGDDESYELIEGWLVRKMTKNDPHEDLVEYLLRRLGREVPDRWRLRCQAPIILADGMPEPDFAIAKGPHVRGASHPYGHEVVLVIEVSDVTLRRDRGPKLHSYARAGIAQYWIINLAAAQLEVYSQPVNGDYAHRQDLRLGDTATINLDDVSIAFPLNDLFPPAS